MPTNVYLSNAGNADLQLQLALLGPSSDFNSNFTLSADSVAALQGPELVMSVDRSPMLFGAPIGMAELRVLSGGIWAGSLVLMLDGRGSPIKNSLDWMIRGPGAETTPMVSDRHAHRISFAHAGQTVKMTVTGHEAGVFDDVYLEVLVEAAGRWTALLTARDENRQRVVAFAIDGDNRPHLLFAPFGADSPHFQEAPVAVAAEPLGQHAVIFENAFDSAQPVWIGCATGSGKLWLQRSDSASGSLLDLSVPARSTIAALAASDAFTIDGSYQADLFLTVLTADQKYRLYQRTLQFQAAPSWTSDWSDWGQTLSRRPSYVRASDARYLFAARPANQVNYCYASPRGSTYGLWRGTKDLPAGISTDKVLAFGYGRKAHPQSAIAVAMRGSDQLLYCASGDALPPFSWTRGSWSLDGNEMLAIEGSNVVPILFRDMATRQVRFARWVVKEAGFVRGDFLGPPATPSCFSGFYYEQPPGPDQGSGEYAVWQQSELDGVVVIPVPQPGAATMR